jgi:preprotein translocase subunit SecD
MTALAILIGLVTAALMLRNLIALLYTRTPQYKFEQRLKRYL